MTTMEERLERARVKIDSALQAARTDEGASPVLLAVVNEFASKAEKAVGLADQRTAVIELEQAGDSAKAAVEADRGASPMTRNAVLEAHMSVCVAKGKLET